MLCSGHEFMKLSDICVRRGKLIDKLRNNIKYEFDLDNYTNKDLQMLKDSKIIFIKTDYISIVFDKLYEYFNNNVIIITHNSDYPITNNEIKYINLPKIYKWYCINKMIHHSNLTSIPIGMANPQFKHGNISLYQSVKSKSIKKDKLLYCNFNTNTRKESRINLKKYLLNKGFFFEENVDQEQYLTNLKRHKFVICPRGNGLDTHRLWETLYMGSIPIVKKNQLIYDKCNELPILFIDSYKQIDKAFLEKSYSNIINNNYNNDYIFISYWKTQFYNDMNLLNINTQLDNDKNLLEYKKHFLSFGNEKFKKSRVRIEKEANDLNIFDNIIIETEDICQEEPFKVVADKILSKYKTTGRGYFWYMWKPYIIYKTLKSLGEGDVLFYCDSGMTIINTPDRINKFKYLLKTVQDKEECPTGIITFITTGAKEERLEYMYNLVQVFKHFNIENDNDIIKTQQYQAGVSVFVKCRESMEIVEKWFLLTQTHPKYFIGDYRFSDLVQCKQMEGYRDHRHDQSIWSILCKLNNVTAYGHDKNPIYQSHKRE